MASLGKLDCVVLTLKDLLRDWTDRDVAAHVIGVALGVFPVASQMSDFRGVFWSRDELGTRLFAALEWLTEAGFLEKSSEESDERQYRWKPAQPQDQQATP